MQYNDVLLRPTKVIAPNGLQTITEYGAGTSESTRFVKVKTQIDETKWTEGYSWSDGLGRTTKTQAIDSHGDIFVLTCYDNMSRTSKTSNPFRNISNPTCSTNLEWTSSIYDSAGRIWKVFTPDGGVIETNYGLAASGGQIGTTMTITDQALKQRRSIINAIGQLIRIDEPDDDNNHNGQFGTIDSPYLPTFYSYDVLSNLITITQGTQIRSFVYDSLSRLKQSTNPEMGTNSSNGTIYYQYDNNSNLLQKTDAQGIQTNYIYDNTNRVMSRTYSDTTPSINYYYDNLTNAKGMLIKVVTGDLQNPLSATEYTSFDTMGRVTGSRQITDGISYNPMSYVYNLSGALLEEKYPSGRVVKNVLDNDGVLEKIQSKKNENSAYWTYAQNFSYTAGGAISSMQLGNGRWESTQFNTRLQPVQIALGTSKQATNLLKLDYEYGVLNLTTKQVDSTKNNGSIGKQTITVPTETRNGETYNAFTAAQYYSYDSLNRIQVASEDYTSSAQAMYNS